jgi:guanylate kinase
MTRSEPTQAPDGFSGVTGRKAGHLFIVSAPSGAGKSTLCGVLRKQFKDLAYSISYTSRTIRKGEQEGRDYYFISEAEFEQGIAQHRWAEWARVHGNYYGTCARWINRTLAQGQDILMDIDVQGTRQMLARFTQAVTIFIMPPSVTELEHRLMLRGQDDPATIALRLKNAKAEMAQKGLYQHVVVNDHLAEATTQLIALLQHHRRQLPG